MGQFFQGRAEGCWASPCCPGEQQRRERCQWDGEWGEGRRLISQSNKNSSSKCTVRLFLWGFHLKSGFAPPALLRVRSSPLCQNSRLRIVLVHLLHPPCTAGSIPWIPLTPCPPCHPIGDAHPNLTLPDFHPSPGTFAELLQNQWSRAELGACGPPFAASLCRVLEQLSPNMEGFFCLRFSARRPRPKSTAFQMLRSAQLLFPPPAPSLLPPSGLGPAPTRTGVNSTPSTHWNPWIPHQHPLLLAQASPRIPLHPENNGY